jgi:hypothetical protein
MAATTGHSINTGSYMGRYRNIFFSEAIELIEHKLSPAVATILNLISEQKT